MVFEGRSKYQLTSPKVHFDWTNRIRKKTNHMIIFCTQLGCQQNRPRIACTGIYVNTMYGEMESLETMLTAHSICSLNDGIMFFAILYKLDTTVDADR